MTFEDKDIVSFDKCFGCNDFKFIGVVPRCTLPEEMTCSVREEQESKPKPPLGATPTFVSVRMRVKELSKAIGRYAEDDNFFDSELIYIWATEIVELIDLQHKMMDLDASQRARKNDSPL